MSGTRRMAGLLMALIVAYAVTGIMLLILALCMYKFGWKVRTVEFGITILYIVASAISGFVAGGHMQSKKYLWGCLSGALYALLLFAISIIVNKGCAGLVDNGISTFFLCLGGGMFGGMIR